MGLGYLGQEGEGGVASFGAEDDLLHHAGLTLNEGPAALMRHNHLDSLKGYIYEGALKGMLGV